MSNLDLTGSIILGGVALLMTLTLSFYLTGKSRSTVFAEVAQANITEFGEVIEYDVNKAGYRVNGTKVLAIDSSSVSFLADLNNDGTADSVFYYTQQVGSDLQMFRRTSLDISKPFKMRVTNFSVQGFDSTGTATTTTNLIKSLLFTIMINETFQLKDDTDQIGLVWRKRFFPKNL